MAGRPCSTCHHPHRAAIHRRLASGEPISRIASEYGLSHVSLGRHKRNCVGLQEPPAVIAKEASKATVALASLPSREELGGRYATLGDRIDAIVQAAEKAGSLAVAVQGLNTLRQNLDSLSKLAGHTGASPQVNVGVAVNISAADIAAELAKQLAGASARVIEAVVDE